MTKFIVDFDLFEKLFNKIGGEPEISIYFNNNKNQYMIIKYNDYITFQRCGITNGSGEIKFNNLRELFETKTIDNICLKEDWNKINDIIIDESLSLKDDLDHIKNIYKL
jgi:hypothetical protein